MNILVLSSLVKNPDVRDALLYNFIERELVAMVHAGHTVTCYLNVSHGKPHLDGVRFINAPSKRKLLYRIIKMFVSHMGKFFPGLIIDPSRTMQILKTEAAVARYLESNMVDVVHTHFLWPGGESCVLAAAQYGVPVVATLRGAELRNLPAMDYGSMRSSCYRYMFGWAKKAVAVFTVPNQELCSLLEEEHGVPPEKVELVFNGFSIRQAEMNALHPVSQRIAYDRYEFLGVGWFTLLKNYEVLFRALPYIRGTNFRLTLVGDGPLADKYEEYRRKYPHMTIRILGTMSRDELLKLIGASDLFLHPSLLEGMPNVVLESMALGTPVAASNISAHRAIIKAGYNGYLFDASNEKEIANIISSVISGTYKISQLSPNCKATAEEFTLERKIAAYSAIYRRVRES